MAEGISCGDVVLNFIGDTQNLDAAFDSVGPKAKAAFSGFDDAIDKNRAEWDGLSERVDEYSVEVEEAGKRTQAAMREAKGEVGLLGEEFGIRLPRHVRSFVAELPGVGEALQAAFSATAILFIAQAIATATEKLTKLTADFLIFTDEMKAGEAGAAAHGQEMTKLEAIYDKDSEALDKFGKTALQVAVMNVAKLTKALDDAKKAADGLKSGTGSTELAYSKWGVAIDLVTSKLGLGNVMLDKALAQQENAINTASEKGVEAKKNIANKEAELDLAKKERDAEALKVLQQHIAALNEADNARTAMYKKGLETQNEAENARASLDKTLTAEHVKQVALANEADTARTQLYQKQEALQNEADMARSKLADQQINDDLKIQEAQKQMAKTILETNAQLKKDTSVTFQTLAQQWMQAAAPLKQLGAMGEEAFNKLTTGLQSAVAAALVSQSSFGSAMEAMTKSVLASVASQALVKSLYYLAEGTASVFENPPAAGAYFTAAAEMAAVGGAAGAAAHFMPGGGTSGGSNNTTQSHTSGSSTSQSNRSGGSLVGVQGFAEGGLIQGPTLAIMGEGFKREAVLPLEDPRAMASIREGIGGGGGVTVHVHGHVIGASDVAHLTKEISKQVNKGKAQLLSSNSLRVTKRSA